MNSRERVLATLNHEEPDRVPVDLGGMLSTGIHVLAYNMLKSYLGISGGRTRIYDLIQQLARPEKNILEMFGADVWAVIEEPEKWKPITLPDRTIAEVPSDWNPVTLDDGSRAIIKGSHVMFKMAKDGYYFDPVYSPLQNANVEDLDESSWLEYRPWGMHDPDSLRRLEKEAKRLYEKTNFALMANFGGNIFETAYPLRGLGKFLVDMYSNQKFAEKLMDRIVEMQKKTFEEYISAVGDYVQIIQVGDDLGTQHGPFMSLEIYRKLLKPRHRRLWQFIKKKTDAYLFLHCCGSISQFIPDLIELGVDALNPVQVSAKGMDTNRLKKDFGDDITFWGGGCDTQKVLPYRTLRDVEEEVRRRIRDLAPGGGFVFSQVHNIQPGVPPENIIAMYRTVRKHGKYTQ